MTHRFLRPAILSVFVVLLACGGPQKETAAPTSAPAQPVYGFEKGSSKLQIGFITVGPVSDYGFNYQHNQGRLALEARMRDKVKTVIVENIPETADVERVMERMAVDGAKLIFATSYGYLDSTVKVAGKTPDVTFMHCLGTKNAPNMGTYSANMWEPGYVSGVVAAMASPRNAKFGFVGAHPIPPVFWMLNAFTLGARSVNKDVTVDVVFTNSWNDPAAETEAVNSLASKGVGTLYILVDSPIAGVQAAERAGLHVLAQHADLSTFAPKGWITGAMWGWGKLYEDVATSVMNKSWSNAHRSGGFREGYVELAPFGPAVDQAARKRAQDLVAGIASGQVQVFAGLIKDNAGKERVGKGQALTIEQVLSLDWMVEGVTAPARR